MNQMEDILVGAQNIVVLAAYVSESRPFEDSIIPQQTFVDAVAAIDALMAAADVEVIKRAGAERCRQGLYSELLFLSAP